MDAMRGRRATPWPPEADKARLQTYARNALLYMGQHEQVFIQNAFGGNWKFQYEEGRDYVAVNLCGALTRLLAWRLFGEPVRIEAPEGDDSTQAFFDHLTDRNRMYQRNLLAAQSASYRGDAVYKVRYDAQERRIRIETINPSSWYPEVDLLDGSKIVAVKLDQALRNSGKTYLWRERHELREGGAGWIVNELYLLHGSIETGYSYDAEKDRVELGIIPELATAVDARATGLDALPIVHVPNSVLDEILYPATGLKLYGASDYHGLETILGELNNRLTQRAEALDKHTLPMIIGPPVADDKGDIDMTRRYFQRQAGEDTSIDVVTWDANLTSVEAALKEARHDFAAVARIDLAALTPPETGAPISGRAIKLSQMTTQDTVRAKQMLFGPALAEVYAIATQMANLPDVQLAFSETPTRLEPEDVRVIISDGLPSDELEDAQIQALRVQAGIQDPTDAMMLLDGVTREEAEEKLARMSAAEAAAMPGVPGGLGPQFEAVTT